MSQLTRRHTLAGLAAISLTGGSLSACASIDPSVIDGVLGGSGVGGLSAADAALGIRAALDNGIGNALVNLGRVGGYFDNPTVRIPLPNSLQQLQNQLAPFGADRLLVELSEQLNRGAEAAAPVARDIFVDAVRGLTIQDALGIIRGPEDAATQYLQQRTTASLTNLFSPIMEDALRGTGALQIVDQIDGQLGVVGQIAGISGDGLKRDLIGHGVEYGLSGVFHFIAEEEAEIRRNPAARTSEILRRVFG